MHLQHKYVIWCMHAHGKQRDYLRESLAVEGVEIIILEGLADLHHAVRTEIKQHLPQDRIPGETQRPCSAAAARCAALHQGEVQRPKGDQKSHACCSFVGETLLPSAQNHCNGLLPCR